MKTFSDLVPGDKIYILEPLSNNIRETTVITAGRHKSSLTGKVWVVTFYKLSNIESIKEDHLKKANEQGTNTTLTLLVEAKSHFSLVKMPNSLMVTVFATDENKLKSWINNKQGKEVVEILKKLKPSH